MPAHPEHITASHALHRVSSFIQILHIARQCGGIATDIDYPLWLHPDDRVEADAVTAFARRIDDDDIGIDLIFSYSLGSTSSAFPTKNSTFSMPFNAAFRRASSIAGGTISTPYTFFAFCARNREMVPIPQYRSHTVSPSVSPAYSSAVP